MEKYIEYKNKYKFSIIKLIIFINVYESHEKTNNLRKLNFISEIVILIDGIGNQSILYKEYPYLPDEIYINNTHQSEKDNVVYNLTDRGNEIKNGMELCIGRLLKNVFWIIKYNLY